jgi:gas vesicle protein
LLGFAAGIAVGVVIGAGAALLLAPQSGADVRRSLARRARRLRFRGEDAWDGLRRELRKAARRRQRQRLAATVEPHPGGV